MTSIVALFELSGSKNCFLVPKNNRRKPDKSNGKISVYEATLSNGKLAFFSCAGDVPDLKSGESVAISGLYADKLGIKDNEQLLLKPVVSAPIVAIEVGVEPLTFDDWEILERSAAQIEMGLLDQVRVVWPSQVIPVWVERSICIFVVIASVKPDVSKSFALLDNHTTVIVSPKIRGSNTEHSHRSPQPLNNPDRQEASNVIDSGQTCLGSDTVDSDVSSVDPSIHRRKKVPSTRKQRSSRSDPALSGEDDKKNPPQLQRRHTERVRASMLAELVAQFWGYKMPPRLGTKVSDFDEDSDELNEKVQPDQPQAVVPQDNLVYRVQASGLFDLYQNLQAKLERESSHDELDGNRCPVPAHLLQPSTVYVTIKDILDRKLGGLSRKTTPQVYYAELRKILSPVEREKAQAEAKKNKEKNKEQPAFPAVKEDTQVRCFVRVVTVNRSAAASSPPWQHAALAILGDHGLAAGHAIIPVELRRQLSLDVTGCVWVKASKVKFTEPATLVICTLSVIPRAVDNKMLTAAFRSWVKMVADDDHPLVIYHGMLVHFKVNTEVFAECQVLLASGSEAAMLLSKATVKQVSVIVQREFKDGVPLPGVLDPLLSFRFTSDFDPRPPEIQLDHLGGVRDLAVPALKHLDTCCSNRPLPRKLFCNRPGLNHGLLLLTGPKGSGKSSLAAALCHAATCFPTIAYTLTVECKPLRGKRIETIRTLLEAAFDEAAWRQPSVLVLDDLDVIAPATDNPGAEISGEALYAAMVSELLQGLVKFEMCNFSRIALIITSQSRSSLHPSIVASRGLHFVQEVVSIKPPDKRCRRELLCSILERHSTVLAVKTLTMIRLDCIADRTEGFVARDMQVLVSRALHYHLAVTPSAKQESVTLTQEDFERALEGFRPLAIRNLTLHTPGDLGWTDVGGLDEVKATLIETLHWPAKYPQLFANCPLRVRSGLLLFGPPGTGKTLLASAVAKECGINFISIKGPELLSKYIGASEQAVRDLFTQAQSAKPCILFFDEFDSIAPKRGHDSTGVTDRVVNQLLTLLDGVEGLQGVYVLGATSRPDLIDPALLRPGRLDKCLYCNIPTQEERRSILAALTQKMRLCDDVDLDEIADMCEHFTGADFKALLYNAQLQAIHEYADLESELDESLVHIKGSPNSCSPVNKKNQITICAKDASLVSTDSELTTFNKQRKMAVAKIKVTLPEDQMFNKFDVPGPWGDAQIMEDNRNIEVLPVTRQTPPPNFLDVVDGDAKPSHHKKSVTFFPKMGDAPAILTPEDEARFLHMVRTMHGRHGELTSVGRRRASSVVARPSVLVPVSQRHLLAASRALRPSVSATERRRYQAIYQKFISGREGNFQTGLEETGMRTTLA